MLHNFKLFITVCSAKVDCEKLMPGKHFTLLLFMFILTLQALKLKHSKYGFENSRVKTVVKMAALESQEK